MIKNIKQRAFTLIELLVVIAIIGILASLIIVSLSGARGKAQDTQRKNNTRNLDTALAQSYTDSASNTYPPDGVATANTGVAISDTGSCASGGALASLFGPQGYITQTTACKDPASNVRIYFTNTGGSPADSKYVIGWTLTSQSEAALNAAAPGSDSTFGNGVYTTNGTTGNLLVNGITNTGFSTAAATKLFVTYGPQ